MAVRSLDQVRIPSTPVVPTEFTDFSRVLKVRTGEMRRGVVFDSIEQLEAALREFSLGERAIVRNRMAERQIRDLQNPNAGIIARVRELDNVPGRHNLFWATFNYSSLDNDSLSVVKIDGKYVMNVSVSGKRNPQDRIDDLTVAERMGAHRAVTEATVVVDYEPVDKLWFNIELGPYAPVLGVDVPTIARIASGLVLDQWNNEVGEPNRFGVDKVRMHLEKTFIHYSFSKGQPNILASVDGTRIFGATNWLPYITDPNAPETELWRVISAEPGFTYPGQTHISFELKLPRGFPEGSGKQERQSLEHAHPVVASKEKIDEVFARRESFAQALRDALIS